MPTVRGLIQYAQSHGSIHSQDLQVLSGTTIGIDAIHYFSSRFEPSVEFETLGLNDIAGLRYIVESALNDFHQLNITPVFVFPGLSQDNRVHELSQQVDVLDATVAAAATAAATASPQIPEEENNDGGFPMPDFDTVTKKKKGKNANKAIAQQSKASKTQALSATTLAINKSVSDVFWQTDSSVALAREDFWSSFTSKHYAVATQKLLESSPSSGLSSSYRRLLYDVLSEIIANPESRERYGSVHIMHAAHSISAQLAWLAHPKQQYIHAAFGHSDVLLFGIQRLIQSISWEQNSFKYVNSSDLLAHCTLEQLISASLLAGYSYALSHPLAFKDVAKPHTFSFSTALDAILVHGKGTLQGALAWWIQQPPCPPLSHTPAGNKTVSSSVSPIPMTLTAQLDLVRTIERAMRQIEGSYALADGGSAVLLRETIIEPLDIPALEQIGKLARQQLKIIKKQALNKGIESSQIAVELVTPIENCLLSRQNLPTVQPFPQVVIPAPLSRLVACNAIQAHNLSVLFSGHLLDQTYPNVSSQQDLLLNWTNSALRGPALVSLFFALERAAQAGTIAPQYASFARIANHIVSGGVEVPALVYNSRFNDARKGIWPRDLIAACRPNDSISSLVTPALLSFERQDRYTQILQQGVLSAHHITTLSERIARIVYNPSAQSLDAICPTSCYFSLLFQLEKLNNNNNVDGLASTNDESIPLTTNQQFIAVGMTAVLFFLQLVDMNGNVTAKAKTLVASVVEALNPIWDSQDDHNEQVLLVLDPIQRVTKWLDTLFLIFLVSACGALNDKALQLESTILSTSSTLLVGQELSGRELSVHLFSRLFALFDNTHILSMLEAPQANTVLIQQLGGSTLGLLPPSAIIEKHLQETEQQNSDQDTADTSSDDLLQAVFYRQETISLLDRGSLAFTSLAFAALQSLRFALDLSLVAVSLNFAKNDNLEYSTLALSHPMISFDPSPILSVLTSRIMTPQPQTNIRFTANSQISSIVTSFWKGLDRTGLSPFALAKINYPLKFLQDVQPLDDKPSAQ